MALAHPRAAVQSHQAPVVLEPPLPFEFMTSLGPRQPQPMCLVFLRMGAFLLTEKPAVVSAAGVVASAGQLATVHGEIAALVLVPHPRRYFLPLRPQVLIVLWPQQAWVTRTSDPCWTRLLSWRGKRAVVAPFAMGDEHLRPLVLSMLGVLQGQAVPTKAVRTVLRLRLSYTRPSRATGVPRRRRRSVRLAGCACTPLRGMVEKLMVPRGVPRHMWSGCMATQFERATATPWTVASAEL